MSKRILIAGNYGQTNTGDEAILAGVLAGLRALDPSIIVSVVTADPAETRAVHGVETVAIRDPTATREAVTGADLVVVGGGGLLNDYWAVDVGRVLFDPGWGLTCHTLPALTAAALGKPYGFLAVGAGPLEDRLAREYVGALLSGASFASVRDEASRRLLISCGADPSRIALAADPAFLLEPDPAERIAPYLSRHGLIEGGDWLAVSLRPWPLAADQGSLVRELAAGLDLALAEDDARALFLQFQSRGGEGDADGPFALAVREQMRERDKTAVLEQALTPTEMAALLRASRGVVAMRLHALLLASLSSTAGVPIAYDPKVEAMAEALGLDDLVIPLAGISGARLAERISQLRERRGLLSAGVSARLGRLRDRATSGVGAAVKALGEEPRLPRLSRLLGAGAIAAARDLASARRENLARREEQERKETCLRAELDGLGREISYLRDRTSNAEAQLAEARLALELAQAETRVARGAAERQRVELVQLHGSRLWKLGNLYWRGRRALGLDRAVSVAPEANPSPLPPCTIPTPVLTPAREGPRPAIPGGLPARHDLLCLPIIDWGFRFQRPQQLMARFAEAGHRVFYVCHRFRQEGPPYELREVRPRVFEVCLRAPSLNVYRDAPSDGVEAMWEGIDALRRDAALGATATIVQLPFWGPLAERLRESFAWPVVYDCLDLHRGFSTNEAPMLELETALLGGADLVAASATVLEQEARRHNPNVVRIPNACDFEHFSAIPQRPPGTPPVVGYYGAISDWFDSALVGELARRHPDWRFLLVGATFGADLGPLQAQPNVELPGEVPYADLPGWLERFDVCIIPFLRTPLTEATDPVKVYEMLAAGKPIVATPLPEIVALGELVRTAAEAGAFEREIAAALAETGSAPAERRRSFAAEQTWEHRYRQLAPAVAAAFPRLSIVIVAYNNVDLTLRCLESLHEISEWPETERIVVDNASADGTAEALARLERNDPGLRLVLNSENRGFAAANNQGLAAASGDFVVLLNNDTVVSRGALATLVRHLQARPEIGLLGPCTNAISNVAQIAVGYGDLSGMNDWAADWTWRSDGRVARLEMAAMFCLAMRREALELLGPLDERFAIGMFEDDDYSLRARRAGLEVCCAYDAFVHHEQKAAFRLVGDDAYQRIFEENRDRFEQKWGPRPAGGHPLSAAVLSRPPREIARRAAAAAGTVILLPSIGWGVHLVQRPHHLARALARRGYLVVFDCSNSQDPVDGFLELEPNLYLFRGKPEVLHALPAPLLWSFPYNYHLCADFPAGAVALYDWIDDLEVFPHDPGMLEENYRRALAEAPIVASVAHRLHAQALALRSDALYLPNAVDVAHFTQTQPVPPEDHEFAAIVASGRRIAGYYGALADWFDYELLAEVAARRADWAFVLIGPDYAGSLRRNRGTLRAENIYCLGPRDYARLPAYLAHFDVATIPFRINDITLATSPLKLFEYFAGGKPVVTTPMPECIAFPEVVIADAPEAFSRGLDEALRRVADPAFRERLRALAHENDWDSRVTAAVALWESKRHIVRRSSPWTTRQAAPHRVNPPLPLAVGTEQVAQPPAAPAPLVTPPQGELPGSALATRFAHLRPAGDRTFFDALLAHLAGIADHPFLPVYVEYAATTVARGRQAVEAIRPHLELTGTRALDIGCAYGGFLVALAEAGARPVGIDVNPQLLELARSLAADHGVRLELYCHDTTKDREEFRGAFDLIVANDVIEHVAALDGFLANLSGWLSPAGLAYLEIPNGRFPGFVRKDGHHGAFAVSLLEFPVAAEILRATGLASAYDTFNYLTLEEYRARFAAHGLALEVLDDTTAWVTREAVLAEVEALRAEWRERLAAEVPAAWQAVVEKALAGYLAEFDAAGLDRPSRESELFERYGVSFWKVLSRHLPEG